MTPIKKGISQEEKQHKLLQWFQSSHDFYTLKEIEQKASKQCKIPPMQIKDLVMALVNDGLVEQEKSGITNLYWSFEYSKLKNCSDNFQRLQEEHGVKEMELMDLKQELAAAINNRNTMTNRQLMLDQAQQLQSRIQCLEEKVMFAKQTEMVGTLKSSIEFYTETLETALGYFSYLTGMPQSVLKQELGLPSDFDDIPTICL
ncbi:MND1 [[Candida] subhashii]|uniref:Meiotic nuclear division protein 1 n=1 Tax=[Candida] subhashii TaxID=561895 RepID=A0A8J5QQH3_9ASCO|nr:MND1 [[Candida] subhashii]KAG7664598.1 MND1 [[Candida] subhashii]